MKPTSTTTIDYQTTTTSITLRTTTTSAAMTTPSREFTIESTEATPIREHRCRLECIKFEQRKSSIFDDFYSCLIQCLNHNGYFKDSTAEPTTTIPRFEMTSIPYSDIPTMTSNTPTTTTSTTTTTTSSTTITTSSTTS